MAILKFTEDTPTIVTLSYDTGKRVEGQYGVQFMWSCNNGDDLFYASPALNTMLNILEVKKGSEVTIEKVRKEGVDYPVFKVNGYDADALTDGVTNGTIKTSNKPNRGTPVTFGDGGNTEQLDRIETMLKALLKNQGIAIEESQPTSKVDELEDIPF